MPFIISEMDFAKCSPDILPTSQGVERIGFNLISDSPVEAQSLSSVESETPVWLQSETVSPWS